jgi:hypothetical protein
MYVSRTTVDAKAPSEQTRPRAAAAETLIIRKFIEVLMQRMRRRSVQPALRV